MTATVQNPNWTKLQNGSDIRGVALPGIPDEPVNLTPDIAETLGKAFVRWLSQTLNKPAQDLTISLGRDSRLSGPDLMAATTSAISRLGCRVYDFGFSLHPSHVHEYRQPRL